MLDPSLHRTQHIRLYAQFRVNLFNRVFVYCIGFCCLPLPWCILLHLNGVWCFYVSKCVILMTGSSQSLTDLLLAPCVPVCQYGLCVSFLILNWFQVTITTSVFLVFFYKCGRTGLWALSTFNSYICPLYPVWGYHDLPSSTSSFGVHLNHIMCCKSTVMGFLLEQSHWTYGWGILLSNPVLNILYPFVWAVSSIDCKQHIQLNAVNFCVVWTVPETHVGWRPVVISAFPLCTSKFQDFVYNVGLRTAMQLSSAGVGQNLGRVWPVATHWTVVGMSQESCSRCGISFVNLIMTWFYFL